MVLSYMRSVSRGIYVRRLCTIARRPISRREVEESVQVDRRAARGEALFYIAMTRTFAAWLRGKEEARGKEGGRSEGRSGAEEQSRPE